jgi:hypothetical protein
VVGTSFAGERETEQQMPKEQDQRATGSRSALKFMGDISKTNAHNLYAEGASNPRSFFYTKKEGKQ